MIRFAWTRFRTQALVGAGVLAIAGRRPAGDRDPAQPRLLRRRRRLQAAGQLRAPVHLRLPLAGLPHAGNSLEAAGLAVPGLIGMFWGAPLVAREFETGTFRLAWTQGVTRTRWLAAKLAVAGAAAIAAGELFTLMVNWWSSPIHKAKRAIPRSRPAASTRASRRPGTRRSRSPSGHRRAPHPPHPARDGRHPRRLHRRHHRLPHLGAAPPHPARPGHLDAQPGIDRQYARSGSLQRAPVLGTGAGGGPARRLGHLLQPAHHPGRPRLLQRASRALRRPSVTIAAQACNDYIESLHLRQTVTYQPASRYWAFQWSRPGSTSPSPSPSPGSASGGSTATAPRHQPSGASAPASRPRHSKTLRDPIRSRGAGGRRAEFWSTR